MTDLGARLARLVSRALLAGLAAAGCVGMQGAPTGPPPASVAAPAQRPPPAPRTDRIVLLVIDGLRWQEVFLGVDPLLGGRAGLPREEIVDAEVLAPNLHALARRGVALGAPSGAAVLATGPNFVSLPGYTEILTGQAAACHENDCPPHGRPTILDEVRTFHGGAPGAAIALSSWERLDRAVTSDPTRVVVSTGRTGGSHLEALADASPIVEALLAQGRDAEPWPGHGDYRPDRTTGELALAVLQARRPRALFLSLGDVDELAHHADYAGTLAAIRQADAILGRMMAEVATWGEEGRHVTFAVTSDHGRCDTFRDHGRQCPESARSFLVLGGGRVPKLGVVPLETEVHLRDLAPTLRVLAGLPAPAAEEGGGAIGQPIALVVSPPEEPRLALR